MSKTTDELIDQLNDELAKEFASAPVILRPDEEWIPGKKLAMPKFGRTEAFRILTTSTETEDRNKPDKTPEKCYHDWVTQTMFRFDTTYCKKCGIEKEKENGRL